MIYLQVTASIITAWVIIEIARAAVKTYVQRKQKNNSI